MSRADTAHAGILLDARPSPLPNVTVHKSLFFCACGVIMELVLLPLLLLAGLMTTLDGGNDDGDHGDGGDGNSNDILSGSGTERVFGGIGDDELTLADQAVGLGGEGDDTIYAQNDAVGYGLEGNDSLTAADNATIMGGEGDDWLSASGEAVAYGGAGADEVEASGGAYGHGGLGDDTLTAQDESAAFGGDGNDLLSLHGLTISFGEGGAGDDTLIGSGHVMASGGSGHDLMVADLAWDGPAADQTALWVQDFTPGQDQLAFLLGDRDISELEITTRFDEVINATVVELTDGSGGPSANVTLEGVQVFDLNDIVLYGETVGDVVEWSPPDTTSEVLAATGTETLYGWGGNDTISAEDDAHAYGGDGNDVMIASDRATAYGRDGDDSLTGTDNATIAGGDGNDRLRSSGLGEAHGGDGNDQIRSVGNGMSFGGPGDDLLWGSERANVQGGIGNDYVQAVYISYGLGGDGDDTMQAWGSSTAEGGAGNDTITVGDNTGSDYDDEADGRSFGYGGAGEDSLIAVGTASAYGGDGNDSFTLVADYDAYDGTPDTAPRAYVLGGEAEGGVGDDQFDDRDIVPDLARGDTLAIADVLHVDAGAGDDTAILHNALRVDLGAGDDVLIVSTTSADDSFDTGTATLGAGADRLIVEPTASDGITQVVTDFDTAADQLGIVIPQTASSSLSMIRSHEAGTNTTVLTFSATAAIGVEDFVIRLEGISASAPLGAIQLYATEAAALAGTAYGTL